MSSELERVIRDFSAAEKALHSLVEQTQSLQTAQSRVDIAFTALETAGTAVGDSHQSLQELASTLADTAAALRASALRAEAATQALLQVDPERLVDVGEETQAEIHKLGTGLRTIIESSASSTTSTVVATIEARTSATTDAVVSSVSGTRAEIAGDVRTLSHQLEKNQAEIEHIQSSLLRVATRQTWTLIVVCLAALLAGLAAAAPLVA